VQRPAPPTQTGSFASGIASKMGDLSLNNGSAGGSVSSGKEKKEKKGLFKMKW
jgi:hypothetical protein